MDCPFMKGEIFSRGWTSPTKNIYDQFQALRVEKQNQPKQN